MVTVRGENLQYIGDPQLVVTQTQQDTQANSTEANIEKTFTSVSEASNFDVFTDPLAL